MEQELFRTGFIPRSLVDDRRVGLSAFRVASYLICTDSYDDISSSQVAKALKISTKTVYRAFDKLEAAGYMTSEKEPFRDGFRRTKVSFKQLGPKSEMLPVARIGHSSRA